MTEVQNRDGTPVCPKCGSRNLLYAHDVSCYSELFVDEAGQIKAQTTEPDWRVAGDFRVFCTDCHWTEENTTIEEAEYPSIYPPPLIPPLPEN